MDLIQDHIRLAVESAVFLAFLIYFVSSRLTARNDRRKINGLKKRKEHYKQMVCCQETRIKELKATLPPSHEENRKLSKKERVRGLASTYNTPPNPNRGQGRASS